MVMETPQTQRAGATKALCPSNLSIQDPKTQRALERALNEAESGLRFASPRSGRILQQAKQLVAEGVLEEVYPGYYARPLYLAPLSPRARMHHLIRSLVHRHPSWTFCLYSAAVVHGLQVPYALLTKAHIGVDKSSNRRSTSPCYVHHALPDLSSTVINGIRVTPLEATIFDCLRHATFRQGLAIVDSSLHHQLTTIERLEAYVDEHSRYRHGIARVRQTLHYADGRSANGGESVVRAAIIEIGFIVPELQVEVPDPLNPNVTITVDFYWRLPDGRIIILELDGLQKYQRDDHDKALAIDETQQILADERRRESHLNLTGATVVRLSYREATDDLKLERALSTAGVPKRL